MSTGRSFVEFVKKKCFDGLFDAAGDFVKESWHQLDLHSYRVKHIENAEFVDATIQRVYVSDLPGMCVAFDIVLELQIEVSESNRHNDYSDECYPWIRVSCEGDLSKNLDDWTIIRIEPYNKKQAPENSLSDALVPYISNDKLEEVADSFLKNYYSEALQIPHIGKPPVYIDPATLAGRLGLTISTHRIKADASVFGQIYFVDSKTEMFDVRTGTTKAVHVAERTIVVDPEMYLLRNVGSVNNTIVHGTKSGVIKTQLTKTVNDTGWTQWFKCPFIDYVTEKTDTYVVQKGDSLWSIAKSLLGDGKRYLELAKINGISAPYTIYSGQVLSIEGERLYTVKTGDSPWRIALELLGDGRRYQEIVEQNGLKEPYTIFTGQSLRIPKE